MKENSSKTQMKEISIQNPDIKLRTCPKTNQGASRFNFLTQSFYMFLIQKLQRFGKTISTRLKTSWKKYESIFSGMEKEKIPIRNQV